MQTLVNRQFLSLEKGQTTYLLLGECPNIYDVIYKIENLQGKNLEVVFSPNESDSLRVSVGCRHDVTGNFMELKSNPAVSKLEISAIEDAKFYVSLWH